MTSKEALRIINLKDRFDIEIVIQANAVLDDLVERDTPVKVYVDNTRHAYCPVCEKHKIRDSESNENQFCSGCGQKLDWSKKNEKLDATLKLDNLYKEFYELLKPKVVWDDYEDEYQVITTSLYDDYDNTERMEEIIEEIRKLKNE